MGVIGIDELTLMVTQIPLFPVNYDLMNVCYLIIHYPDDVKKSHISIMIDIGGNSTLKYITGLMIHLIANMNDGQYPHSTTIKNELYTIDRSNIQIINLGNISESRYLIDTNLLPSY